MITCPVALALMFLSPLPADVVESDSKTDLNVLRRLLRRVVQKKPFRLLA
ncbi:MAG: hypothetical protein ACKO85_12750 [Isosphaeraceae bacterium]